MAKKKTATAQEVAKRFEDEVAALDDAGQDWIRNWINNHPVFGVGVRVGVQCLDMSIRETFYEKAKANRRSKPSPTTAAIIADLREGKLPPKEIAKKYDTIETPVTTETVRGIKKRMKKLRPYTLQ